MLSSKNLYVNSVSKKLLDRFIRLFKMLQLIRTQAYRLALLNQYRVYNVFHVLLLELYYQRVGYEQPKELTLLELVDSNPEYKVKVVLYKKTIKGQVYYLVKQKDQLEDYNQQVVNLDISNASKLVQEYKKERRYIGRKQRKYR